MSKSKPTTATGRSISTVAAGRSNAKVAVENSKSIVAVGRSTSTVAAGKSKSTATAGKAKPTAAAGRSVSTVAAGKSKPTAVVGRSVSTVAADKSKSTATTSKSGRAAEFKEGSGHTKNVTESHRINVPMVQNVLLIWLDSGIDDNSTDCQNTIRQLRRTVNTINTFTDAEECVHFLENMINEKACMIISGALGQHVVPRVHTMSQVDSIFIFCSNREYQEQWIKDWSKIKGVFTEINSISDALKQTAQQCEQNAISISILNSDEDISKKNLDQLDPSFMYSQIIKEILLTIKFEPQHFQEFITYCRGVLVDNEGQLEYVDEFERTYRDQTPIWWYTLECFLYPMLNRALRSMDTDLIIKVGFFIGDLHRHIDQLHNEQFRGSKSEKSFLVYRGQGMDKAQFEKMTANKGGLLSFNCFLSTSKDRTVSSEFAQRSAMNPDLVGVLFVMTIDPAQFTTPFALITDVSYYGSQEEEVLFSMHTVFRIRSVTPMDDNHRLFQVELSLTSDKDKDFRQLSERIRQDTYPDATGWTRLGLVLLQMGEPEKTQRIYEILLEQETEETAKVALYNQLGVVKSNQGEYKEAIKFYEKSLAIKQQCLPPDHPDLADSYNNIGDAYRDMGDYSEALSFLEKALAMRRQTFSPNHLGLASSYNNLGAVYQNMGDYPKALSSYEKALAIEQQSLPPNHPDFGMSHSNIGEAHRSMGNYPEALSSHEKGLAIRQQSLPPNHPDLAASYNNIGEVYRSMDEYPEALSFYEKALAIFQQTLPPNHPYLAACYNNLSIVYDSMGDHSEALSFLEKALAIRQQSLPPNHPDLATTYINLGTMYDEMSDYREALSSYEKALAIFQQSLSSNHPHLAFCYNNIGAVCDSMGNSSKALSSYEKALAIRQQSLPPNHPDLAISHYNIGLLYDNMGNYSKACSSYKRAVAIGQKALPSNHPQLRKFQRKLADVKKKL